MMKWDGLRPSETLKIKSPTPLTKHKGEDLTGRVELAVSLFYYLRCLVSRHLQLNLKCLSAQPFQMTVVNIFY